MSIATLKKFSKNSGVWEILKGKNYKNSFWNLLSFNKSYVTTLVKVFIDFSIILLRSLLLLYMKNQK